MNPRTRRWSIGCGGAAAALVVAIVLANLWPESDLVEHRVISPYSVDDPRFVRTMSSLLGPPLVEGNRIVELTNGEETFPAMLEAIRGAQRSITFETYIYWEGAIGERFAAALAERARAGIRVHLLLDWAGSQRMDEESLAQLRAAGADVALYRRPRWHNLGELNERTHRSSSSSTAGSASPAGSESQTSGAAMAKIRSIGAIRTSGWKGRSSLNYRLHSWTTGSGAAQHFCMATRTFHISRRAGSRARRRW